MGGRLRPEEVLQPFPFENDALRRGRDLLILPGVLQGAHALFEPGQNIPVETLRVEDVALLPDDLPAADGEGDDCALRGLCGEAQMGVAQVLRHNVPGQVLFVEALHDDNERAGFGVVQTALQRVLEKADRSLPLRFAVGLEGVLRIVQDDDVAALAGQGSADGRGKHHPLAVVLKFILPVDVVLEGEAVAPGLLIPWR